MDSNNILNNINIVAEKLFKSVEGQVYTALDKIVVIGPEILNEEPLKNICKNSFVNDISLIANVLVIFYVIYFVFNQFINIYNGNNYENIYKFIIRTVIIEIAITQSYYICEEILNIFKILTNAIDELLKGFCKEDISFESFKKIITNIDDIMNDDLLSLNGIIKGMISFGSVSVLINFAIRYVTTIFLVIISPFAILTLESNISSGIFKSWIKLLFTNLIVQIIIKFVIVIPIMFKNKEDLMYKIILVGSIYIIYKINSFTKEIFAKITESTIGRN